MFTSHLDQINSGHDLSADQAAWCLQAILAGKASDQEVADLLVALAEKGEAPTEITAFTQGLLDCAQPLELAGESIDLCGTGGSQKQRFNVSTAAAFVVAAGGVPVAKHGNRGSRQPNGSFDFLDALDCPYDFSPQDTAALFRQLPLCFLFARLYHPAMKQVAPARQLAARRTIFNLVGPLANPARPAYQLVGAPDLTTAKKLVSVLQDLGKKRCLIFTGAPGLDDISISGPTQLIELDQQSTRAYQLQPEDFGLEPVPYDTIPGGDGPQNSQPFLSLLAEGQPRSLLDLVCLNAGAAFYCVGKSPSIKAGYQLSRDLFANGQAKDIFDRYNQLASTYQKHNK